LRAISFDRPRYLLVILSAAFALRILVGFFSDLPQVTTDSELYLRMADDIIEGNPWSFFPNGFPLIIAGLIIVFGDEHYMSALMLMNASMSTCIVWLVHQIAKPILEYRFALLATLLTALWPNQLYYVRQVMTEVPSTFFMILGIYLLLKRSPFSAGLLLCVAGLLRTSLAPVAILIAGMCLVVPDRRRGVPFLLAAFACGYAAEYALQASGVVQGSSNISLNLLLAIIERGVEGPGYLPGRLSEHEMARPLATYLGFATARPWEFIEQRLLSLYELWGPWPGQGDENSLRPLARRLIISLRFPLLLMALAGLWNRRDSVVSWIIASPVLVVTAVHAAFYSAQTRFTYPAEPFAIILASAAVADLSARWAQTRKPVSRLSG
jgi:hypothetical protein